MKERVENILSPSNAFKAGYSIHDEFSHALSLIKDLWEENQLQGWLPIYTAPKNGSKIEVWHKIHKCVITVKYIVDERYRPNSDGKQFCWVTCCGSNTWTTGAFTGWRPTPQPPEGEV